MGVGPDCQAGSQIRLSFESGCCTPGYINLVPRAQAQFLPGQIAGSLLPWVARICKVVCEAAIKLGLLRFGYGRRSAATDNAVPDSLNQLDLFGNVESTYLL